MSRINSSSRRALFRSLTLFAQFEFTTRSKTHAITSRFWHTRGTFPTGLLPHPRRFPTASRESPAKIYDHPFHKTNIYIPPTHTHLFVLCRLIFDLAHTHSRSALLALKHSFGLPDDDGCSRTFRFHNGFLSVVCTQLITAEKLLETLLKYFIANFNEKVLLYRISSVPSWLLIYYQSYGN